MPHFTLEISPQGPLLNAFISVSEGRKNALEQAKLAVPNFVRIRALVDTGASITCIDPSVLKDSLELPPTGSTVMITPSTGNKPVSMDLYDVGLWIPPIKDDESWFSVGTMPVVCSDLLKSLGYHALIGRDVLEKCMFSYNGSAKIFTLAY